jgi:glycosyltransferase involved in cell wall biosynthesis
MEHLFHTKSRELDRLKSKYAGYFHESWYLDQYPDVRDSQQDPILHFIEHGESELRNPNPIMNLRWFVSQYNNSINNKKRPFEFFLNHCASLAFNPNPFLNLKFIKNSQNFEIEAEELLSILISDRFDYTSEWFSKIHYSNLRGIASNSVDLFQFAWQDFIADSLKLVENFCIMKEEDLDPIASGEIVEILTLENSRRLILKLAPNDAITDQIRELINLEGNIAVAPMKPITSIPVFEAIDLKKRDGLNLLYAEQICGNKFTDVFLISNLIRGGATTYLLEILELMSKNLKLRILVILTSSTKIEMKNQLEIVSSNKISSVEFIIIDDVVGNSSRQSQILMQFLMLLGPNRIWIMNSTLGYELVSKYGKNLIDIPIQTFCFFFSESQNYLSHSRVWRRKMVPYSTIVSDNATYFSQIEASAGRVFDSKVVLRRAIDVDLRRSSQVIRSRKHRRRWDTPLKILWYGRWEKLKDTWLLLEMSQKFEFVHFSQYGTFDTEPPRNVNPNLTFNGGVKSFYDIPVDRFDFLFFTSEFEGMPNVVLEAVSVGLPVIAADVGGLKEVFGHDSIIYFKNSPSPQVRLKEAERAISRAIALDMESLDRLVDCAHKALEEFHKKTVILKNLNLIIDESVAND